MTALPRSPHPRPRGGRPGLAGLPALAPGRVRGGVPRLLCALAVVVAALSAGPASGASASTARLGNTRVGGSFDRGGAGYLDVSGPFRTSGGTVAALTAYVRGESRALSVRGVVYADAGGRPGRLIGASRAARVAAGAAGAWVRLPLRSAARLARGGYWLGFWYGPGTGSDGGGFAYASSQGREWYAPARYSPAGSPPARFPGGAASSSSYSIYASLVVSKPQATAAPKKKSAATKTAAKKTAPKKTAPNKDKDAKGALYVLMPMRV